MYRIDIIDLIFKMNCEASMKVIYRILLFIWLLLLNLFAIIVYRFTSVYLYELKRTNNNIDNPLVIIIKSTLLFFIY